MSSYIHVFARKNETFVELLCYGRSSKLYELFGVYAPYEHIRSLPKDIIARKYDDAKQELNKIKESKQHVYQRIHEIGQWNNSVVDKRNMIEEEYKYIDEIEEEIAEYNDLLSLLLFLVNCESRLYVGIECGSSVSADDLVDEDEDPYDYETRDEE